MAENKVINLEVNESGMEELTGKTKSLKAQLKELKVQMAAAGDGTAEFRKLAAEAGALKDRLDDVNRQVKNLSSDTQRLDLGLEAVTAITSGYEAAQGAMYLFGNESEEMQKTMQKVMGAMALANGVQQIANVLNKDAVLGTKLRILWNDKLVGTFKELTDAQKAFAVTGVGLLLTAIAALVANFDALTSSIFGVSESQQALNETVEDYQKGAAEAAEITSKVGATFKMAREGVVSKEEALNYYNETLGDTFGKAVSLDEAEELWAKKTKAYIRATGLRAQAQALFAKAAEAAAKGTTAGLEDQTTLLDKLGTAALQNTLGYSAALSNQTSKQKQRVKEAEVNYKKQEELLNKQAADMLAEAIEEEKANGIVAKSNQHKNKAVVHSNKNARKDDLKNQKDFNAEADKLEQERQNALQDRLAEIQDQNYENTLSAYDLEIRALNEKYFEIETLAEGNAEALKEIEIAKMNERNDIELKYQEISYNQQKEANAKQKELDDKAAADRIEAEKTVAETLQAIREADLNNISAGIGLIKDLFEKNKKVQAAALIAENAVGIAKTIISTKAANQAARAQGTALAIASGGASTLAAEALILRNNIGAGVSIAAQIAATAKGVAALGGGGGASTSGGGGLSNGGGGGGVSPNFNVVGNSGMNQLAQIQQTPLQAYVVSGEVTSAQALDRNRIKNATL